MSGGHQHEHPDWQIHGVKVIPGDQLDRNTAQTPGMDRAAAINFARVGAQKIWAGTVKIHADAKTGAHHHGALESVIYVLKGRARMRWGDHLEYVAEAGPATSSSSRPMSRTRRSTPHPTRRSNACWCAATTKPSWSISTSRRLSARNRCAGSIRSTATADPPLPGPGGAHGADPMRVSSTKLSVAASIARPLRPRGAWM